MNFSYNTTTTTAKRIKPWQGILFGLIFAVVGIGLLFFSIKTITSYNEKNSTYTQLTAEVTDYATDDEGLKAIIVEYQVNGNTYTKTSNAYSNTPKSIGTKVDIKYNPSSPSDAIWVSDSTNIVMPLFGGVFTLVGIIVVVMSAKKMKNGEEYV